MALRVGFAGTPSFAATALRAIVEAGITVPLVLTLPDKPKGRGLRVVPSEVAEEAARHGLAIAKPASLRAPEVADALRGEALDALIVAAYGLILPQGVLALPRYGCLNIHASLLPRWRGAAPIERAIEAGDRVSGVTIMQMDAGLDTGPTIAAEPVTIEARETAGTLHDKLARAGAGLVVATLQRLARDGRLAATPQPASSATYAAKIGPDDARIDWRRDAAAIDRQVRAFDPLPGAFTSATEGRVKVWRAEPLAIAGSASPGTVVETTPEGIDVACGAGRLRIVELQPAGGRRMGAAAATAGRLIATGMRFA